MKALATIVAFSLARLPRIEFGAGALDKLPALALSGMTAVRDSLLTLHCSDGLQDLVVVHGDCL